MSNNILDSSFVDADSLDVKRVQRIARHLNPDEKLLWTGQPSSKVYFFWKDVRYILAGLAIIGVMSFILYSAKGTADFIPC
ncbi:MAG: hypothetical protein AAF598_20345 [Bacteroidota bacterium]